MSEHCSDDIPGDRPENVFEVLGLDEVVMGQMAADLTTPGPQKYENAHLWASALLAAANEVVNFGSQDRERSSEHGDDQRVLDVEELTYAVHLAAGANFLPDSPEGAAISSFLDGFKHPAVSKNRQLVYNLPRGGFYTESVVALTLEDAMAADFIARHLEVEDIDVAIKEDVELLMQRAAEMTATETAEIAATMRTKADRIAEIATRPIYGPGSEPQTCISWDENDKEYVETYYSYAPDARTHTPLLGSADLETSIAVITQHAAELERIEGVRASVPSPESNIETLGAKGAHLVYLQKALEALRSEGSEVSERITIPPFSVLPAAHFESWRQTGKVMDSLKIIDQWIKGTDPNGRYVLRSSAVHSEDGEHTGAGVYASVLLPERPTLRDIRKALLEVYQSVDSPEAIAYRSSIGVTEESMAVVIHKIEDDELWHAPMVTLNTLMPHVPQLAEYMYEGGRHPLSRSGGESITRHVLPLDRNGMALELGTFALSDLVTAPRFHVPPDIYFLSPQEIALAAQAGMLVERLMGRPVQIEALFDQEEVDNLKLVQARPLPKEFSTSHNFIGFPENEKPWFTGRGIGVLNGEEAVVLNEQYSAISAALRLHKGNILVQFKSSHGLSDMIGRGFQAALASLSSSDRQRLICLVQSSPTVSEESGYGHLETLFAEIGIRMIFVDPRRRGVRVVLEEGQKAQLYSDGYHAKIYASEDDPVLIRKREAEQREIERLERANFPWELEDFED